MYMYIHNMLHAYVDVHVHAGKRRHAYKLTFGRMVYILVAYATLLSMRCVCWCNRRNTSSPRLSTSLHWQTSSPPKPRSVPILAQDLCVGWTISRIQATPSLQMIAQLLILRIYIMYSTCMYIHCWGLLA